MVAADIRSLLLANLKEVGNKSLFGAFFDLEVSNSKNSAKILTKNSRSKQIVVPSLTLTVKQISLFPKILPSFSRILENLVKN